MEKVLNLLHLVLQKICKKHNSRYLNYFIIGPYVILHSTEFKAKDSYGFYNIDRSCTIAAALTLLRCCEGSVDLAGTNKLLHFAGTHFLFFEYGDI